MNGERKKRPQWSNTWTVQLINGKCAIEMISDLSVPVSIISPAFILMTKTIKSLMIILIINLLQDSTRQSVPFLLPKCAQYKIRNLVEKKWAKTACQLYTKTAQRNPWKSINSWTMNFEFNFSSLFDVNQNKLLQSNFFFSENVMQLNWKWLIRQRLFFGFCLLFFNSLILWYIKTKLHAQFEWHMAFY